MKTVIKVNATFVLNVEGLDDKGNEFLKRIKGVAEMLETDDVIAAANKYMTEALCDKFDYYDEERGLSADVNECTIGTEIKFVDDKEEE